MKRAPRLFASQFEERRPVPISARYPASTLQPARILSILCGRSRARGDRLRACGFPLPRSGSGMVGYFRAARVSNSSGEGMGALRREEKPVAAWREDVDTISSFGQSESGPRRHILIWHVDCQGHYLAERTACSSGVTARVFWAAAVNGQWRFLQTRPPHGRGSPRSRLRVSENCLLLLYL